LILVQDVLGWEVGGSPRFLYLSNFFFFFFFLTAFLVTDFKV